MDWIARHRLFEKVYKVRCVIRSCVTDPQLESAIRMADNFVKQQAECYEKHIANCLFQAEIGKKIIQISKQCLKG